MPSRSSSPWRSLFAVFLFGVREIYRRSPFIRTSALPEPRGEEEISKTKEEGWQDQNVRLCQCVLSVSRSLSKSAVAVRGFVVWSSKLGGVEWGYIGRVCAWNGWSDLIWNLLPIKMIIQATPLTRLASSLPSTHTPTPNTHESSTKVVNKLSLWFWFIYILVLGVGVGGGGDILHALNVKRKW